MIEKVCTRCVRRLPLSSFRPRQKKECGKIYRYINSTCRKCESAAAGERGRATNWQAQKTWCVRHPEKRRELERKSDQARCRRWYRRNREQEITKQKLRYLARADEIRAQARQRRKENPALVVFHTKNRHHKKRANGGSLTRAEWQRIVEDFRGQCAYCPAPATEMDHVHPISRGGTHDAGNVVPACNACNNSKRARTVDEWLHGVVDVADAA